MKNLIASVLFISLLLFASCDESTKVFNPNESEYVDVSIEKLNYPNNYGIDHNIQDIFIEDNEMFILTDKDFSTDGSQNFIYRSSDLSNWTSVEKSDSIDAENLSYYNEKIFISNNFGLWMYDGLAWLNIHSNKAEVNNLLSGTNGIFIPASDLIQNDSTAKQVFGYLN